MSAKKLFLIVCTFLLLVSIIYADDYKPYLHSAKVPNAPQVRLFGQYSTNLFPGSATYNYPIETPIGVNGLKPDLFVYYSSQSSKGRPGILGAGWSLNQDLIYRDVKGTPDDTSDDKYIMILDGNQYELVYLNGEYKTEVDYWFKIVKNSTFWTVTKQDGKKYIFAYTLESSKGYTSKWFLSSVEDTHDNDLYYSYSLNPNSEDSNAVYLSNIKYNSDQQRVITFNYENSVRPDRRRVYDQGNLFEESRRLTDITITVDGSLVKRHHFTYVSLTPSLSSLSKITLYGNDNASSLFNISFEYYTPTTGFTNQTSTYKPVDMFSDATTDYGFQLVDVNNDGLIDIIQGREANSLKKVWINNKINSWIYDSSWNLPEYIVHTDSSDEGVRFADVNNDGYIDILKSKNGETKTIYLNTWTAWQNSSWSIPIDFVSSAGVDQGVQIVDVNGDGRVDLVQGKPGASTTYLNTGSGWSASSWSVPVNFVDASGVDQGVRLIDINSDGLPDLLQGTASTKKAWLNNGAGWTDYDSVWAPSIAFIDGTNKDSGVRFADVNGDGLVDILSQSTTAYLNNGAGWTLDNSWKSPEDFIVSGKNVGRRLADVDGDGFVDMVISHAGTNYTWTKNATLPFMLKSITNEYGGVTSINYTKSTEYDNVNLGFNIFVVNNVTKNNSMVSSFNMVGITSYNYSNGKYNYDKQEFRGFGISTEIDNDSVTKHYFLQDDARRGKEYQTETYDKNNNLFFKNTKDYNYTYAGGIYNLSLKTSTDYIYDGQPTPKTHNISYAYNLFGNPQFITDYGDSDIVGDEKYYNYSYGFNFDNWIINKVSRVTAYDSNFNKVKETKYYYDNLGLNGVGSKGELTKTENWLESGNNTYNYFDYDSYGNLISKTDSLGNIYKYRYDALNIFIESIVNPLGHVQTFSYDSGTGNLLSSTSNGITTYFIYDTFGRIVKEIKPYDSTFLPTKNYVYSFDGVAPEKITVKQKTTANDTDNTNFFYDGLGNIVQIKQEIENEQEVVKNIFYDNKFRVGSEQNPYFSTYNSGLTSKSSTDNITTYNYDSLSRVTRVVNPDGTNKTVSFNQYNITDFDENGHKHTYTIDAYGRIIRVYEYNKDPYTQLDETYTTKYDYDSNDNLIKIMDNKNHQFQFFYDALGRKIKMIDPDMGTWTYEYDANNNLIKQTNNKNNQITLNYDALNRIKTKISDDVNTTFNYDTQYYGTLANVSASNDVSKAFTYDKRMRNIKTIYNFDNQSLQKDFVYDYSDRMLSDSDFNYTYSKIGKVNQIAEILTSANFNAFGSIASKTYGNSVLTNYSYRADNGRLLTISSVSVQNLAYTYDSVGNIMTINDSKQNKFYNMTYDSLDRLTKATIGTDAYSYYYDSLGRIKKMNQNNQSKKIVYAGSQAHAPSKIVDGAIGVDLQNPHELDTNSKTRVFEFYLVNDLNLTISSNFSINFDDETPTWNSDNFNITDSMIVIVEQNYAHGGDYDVNFTASSNGISDYESKSIKFGTHTDNLDILYSYISERIFELVIGNDVKEQVNNINWNCSEGLYSYGPMNLSGNSSSSDLIDYIYQTGPGRKTFQCNVTSDDGSDSISKDFTIEGLEVADYDVLYSNISRYVIAFDAKNHYENLSTNIKVSTNGETFNKSFNISSGDDIFVITEINYSSDGQKDYQIDFTSNTTTTSHVESFLIPGVSIQNYQRLSGDYTNQILMFEVINNWQSGNISWNLTNPDMNATSDINNGESVAVIIENDYNSQGDNKVEINSRAASYTDRLTDFFDVAPLQIASFEALTPSIFEIVARNNMNSAQTFGWQVDSIASTDTINLTNDDAYIIVEKSTSTGLNVLTGSINSTGYSDNESEVVVK